MTNQERLQQNNEKIEAIQNKLNTKIIEANLDAELDTQEALLVDLRTKVNELPDKQVDVSQTTATADDVFQGKQFYNAQGELVEGTRVEIMNKYLAYKKSCSQLFYGFPDEDMSWVKNLDTTSVTDMFNMFAYCENAEIIDASNFDFSNVTKVQQMFVRCKALKSIHFKNFNAEKCENLSSMFSYCGQLEEVVFENANVPNCTNMQGMFSSCTNLKRIDLTGFTSNKITNLRDLCNAANNLVSINLGSLDTSNCSNFSYMFSGVYKLETIEGVIDLLNATNISGFVGSHYELQNVTLKNIKLSLTLGSGTFNGTKLTNKTLINTIKELWDNTDNALGDSRTLYLSTPSRTNIANIYVKLIDVTDEMRAEDEYIDNKKPCVVCESTDEGAMTLTEYMILKNWSLA